MNQAQSIVRNMLSASLEEMNLSVLAYKRGASSKKKRSHPEQDFQVEAAKYLKHALPPAWRYTASGAGLPLPRILANLMKAMGQTPGWSDLILRQVGTGETRWLEAKSMIGRLSPEQIEFRDDCPQHFAVARTLADVEAALISWGITPRCTIGAANRYAVNKPLDT